MAVCVLRLFLGFLLLFVKLNFPLNDDDIDVLDRRGGLLAPNYDLLFQLGFVRAVDDCDKDFCGMFPRGVFLFRKMIFTRCLAKFSCVILLLCSDIHSNPGPSRCLCGVCGCLV